MPIRSRARTARAILRDEEILEAALAEVAESGLDALGMHAVARRVGITAGAVYARHETPDELAVAVWEERCREPFLGLLSRCIDVAGGGGDSPTLVESALGVDDAVRVGLEFVALARRRPELSEIIAPEIDRLLAWESRSPREKARLAFLVGIVWGVVLHDNVSTGNIDIWRIAMALVTRAIATDHDLGDEAWRPELGEAISARTGDALRDALVDSARSVIGQVGLHSTTVSRIGRRAGLSAGAVYTRYASKDDLLIDAMRVLLDEAISDNQPVTDRTVDRVEMGNVAAHLLTRGGGEKRRPWLRFRLEAYVAASHRRDLAAVLDELHDGGRQRYHVMLAPAGVTPAVADLVAIVGRAIPLGLAVLDAYVDDLAAIDFRHVTMPLLGFVADAAGAP